MANIAALLIYTLIGLLRKLRRGTVTGYDQETEDCLGNREDKYVGNISGSCHGMFRHLLFSE